MTWQTVDRKLKEKKWSLKKLSSETGINYETIRSYRYQHIEPSFKNMCKVADALNVKLDDLRGEKDE